jgi:deoxyadenosine/deoxycytidine kinase
MDLDYIAGLHAAYNQYFRQYDRTPLLVVNAAEIDFVENRSDFRALTRHIATPLAPGTRHVHL